MAPWAWGIAIASESTTAGGWIHSLSAVTKTGTNRWNCIGCNIAR